MRHSEDVDDDGDQAIGSTPRLACLLSDQSGEHPSIETCSNEASQNSNKKDDRHRLYCSNCIYITRCCSRASRISNSSKQVFENIDTQSEGG